MSIVGFAPQDPPPPEPTNRPLQLGDIIDPSIPLWIVADGPNISAIGTLEALSLVPGRTLLQEGTVYDPEEFPVLAQRLKSVYGQHAVPILSKANWL